MRLSNDEKNILKSYERGEWTSTKRLSADRKQLAQYAKTALRKDKRVNIRISENDLCSYRERPFRTACHTRLLFQVFCTSS